MVSRKLKFDLRELRFRTREFNTSFCTAFASACSTRMANAFAAHSLSIQDVNAIRHAVQSLWGHLISDRTIDARMLENDILERLPDEEADPSFSGSVADDALATTAYALRTIYDDAVTNACWAAQRSYDLVDRYAARRINVPEYTAPAEEIIVSSEVVQLELRRQRRDLDLLLNSGRKPKVSAIFSQLRNYVANESTIPFP